MTNQSLPDDAGEPAPLVVHCDGGRAHAACRQGRAQAKTADRPLIVAHAPVRARPDGATLTVDLTQLAESWFDPNQRERLEHLFELWTLVGWLEPRAVGSITEARADWSRVVPAHLDECIGDLVRILTDPLPEEAAPTTPAGPPPEEPSFVLCVGCKTPVAHARPIPPIGLLIKVPCGCGGQGVLIVRPEPHYEIPEPSAKRRTSTQRSNPA